ncbi:MAG: LamG-like jellyroll fold domain-containing protein, partial [Candidatus Howiella sp.]
MKAKRILACILSAAMLISMFAATSIPSVSAVISDSDVLLDLDFSAYNGEATLADKTGNLTVDMTGIEVGEGRETGTASAKLDGTDAIRWRGAEYDPFALTDTGFTLSVWYNVSEFTNWTQWFAYGRCQNYGMILQYGDNGAANPKLSYNTHPQLKEGTGYPGENQWVMVTVKQDYDTKLLSVYVNGQLISAALRDYTMKDIATLEGDYNASYNLGAPIDRETCWDYWSGDGKLNGLIGSCAIYGRALTDSEIAKLYNSEYVEPEQPTVSSGLLLDLDFSAYNGEATLADKTGNLTVDMTGIEVGEGRETGTASAKLDGTDAIRWRGEDYDPFVHTDTGMTINMWLSIDTFKEWSQYFTYGRSAGFGLVMQYSSAHAAHFNMVYGATATGDGDSAYPGTGTWMMITLTQDYATNSLSLYVNGECKLTRDMPADMKNVATFGSANAQYNIGAPVDIFDQWSSDGKLDGCVDSLQIYGSAKTATEIAELYAPTPSVDQEAIDNVISLIDAIGEVAATAASESKIVAAETAYAAL